MPNLKLHPNDPNLIVAEAEMHAPVYLDAVSHNIRTLGLQNNLDRVGLYSPHLFEHQYMWYIGREVEESNGFWFLGEASAAELLRQSKMEPKDCTGLSSQFLPALQPINNMIGILYNHSVYVRPELEPNLFLLVLSDESLVCGGIGGLAVIHSVQPTNGENHGKKRKSKKPESGAA